MEADFWNARYGASTDYVFGTEPNGFLAECARAIPSGGPVLCLAEGEGRNAVFLAGLGHSVTAVDQSMIGLEKAHALASARGVEIRSEVAELSTYSIVPGAWGAVVWIFLHLAPPLRERVLEAAIAGLMPGGVLVLEVYAPDQVKWRTGGPVKTPELLASLEAIRSAIGGRLDLEIGREVEREVVEGSGHTGRAAVTQVLGRKR
jgi:SAM-dependent methyltransferase